MCGIFGYFGSSDSASVRRLLTELKSTLNHRGPDDSGIFVAEGVGIGNTRLSVIDVENGHQPFISEAGDIAVVQNGEIYNYQKISEATARKGYPCKTKSDTETILRAFQVNGSDFVEQLNGMFAIAIYNRNDDTLLLLRDRLGIKPLFYYDGPDGFIFGSEIKALLKAGAPRQVNYEALHYFHTIGYVPPHLTMFEGIFPVAPGSGMLVSRKNISKFQWWDLSPSHEIERSESEWKNDFLEKLEQAVRLRIRSDVPFGAFLSGGVDSSSVVGIANRMIPDDLKTFTISFPEARFDESAYAQFAADRFGTDHNCRQVDPSTFQRWAEMIYYCDQPHSDSSFMPVREVSALAREQVKVVLTGDGGDELFGGYTKYLAMVDDTKENHGGNLARLWLDHSTLFSDEIKSQLYHDDLEERISSYNFLGIVQECLKGGEALDEINQLLYLDLKFLLPGNNLVKPDRMGMSESLEARSPFLDVNMVEFAFTMPGNIKIQNGETKYIFKKAVEELISTKLAFRPKQQFTMPIGEWLRDPNSTLAADILLSKQANGRNLYKSKTVRTMIDEHRSMEKNYTRELRSMIALELWFRVFIDNSFDSPPTMNDIGITSEVAYA
jgi:asparagine synthase (glutamine-hydrolysing)